jgi:hypothetical protein
VEQRFPGGCKEIEPLVEAAGREAARSPYVATVVRIRLELERG